MGKRKRSDRDDNDSVEKLLKKVKRLVKSRKRIPSSSSSEGEPVLSPARSPSPPHDLTSDLEPQVEILNTEIPLEGEGTAVENPDELDPDILQLLGSDPTLDKPFGENLHKDLATRWKHILINGLTKEDKVDLLKQYLPAENCIYMKAPILNPELKSALSDPNIKKDSYSEQKQNQMASCISAIGKALNIALSQTENIPQDIIKTLSDAGRLLCDTHYRESLSRRFAIINAISKQKREIIKNTKIDDYLFGTNLSDYLKSTKAITMSASELRANANSGRFNQQRNQPSTSTYRQTGALNARGAPRAAAAESRVHPTQSRRPPPPPRDPRRAQPATRARAANYSARRR